ncbi:MAG: DUF2190 family protein [Clostridia bacterium]|nr:DUF2190 family protein [Clostridia bacterium]
MSKAAFWQKGESLDYRNSTNAKIEANTIVAYGDRIGVIGCDILPGELGSLFVGGAVFEMPKADTAAIAGGAELYWDGSGITAASGSGTVRAGYAAQPADAAAETVLVRLDG